MYTNSNKLRDIIEADKPLAADDWEFTPSADFTLKTGLLTVEVEFSSGANAIGVKATFIGNPPRDDFFSAENGFFNIGGIIIDGSMLIDATVDNTLVAGTVVSLDKYNSELLAFKNTLILEIGADANY